MITKRKMTHEEVKDAITEFEFELTWQFEAAVDRSNTVMSIVHSQDRPNTALSIVNLFGLIWILVLITLLAFLDIQEWVQGFRIGLLIAIIDNYERQISRNTAYLERLDSQK